jgi:excisionase family DNA binding protein
VSDPLPLTLPPEAVEALVERVAELVLERLEQSNGSASPWMTRETAARYLSLPRSRLEKDRAIPCHREGRRVLYHRAELDDYLRCDASDCQRP